MDIVVLVKDVPNPSGMPPEIGPDHLLRREEPGGGLDPADEPGVELAVTLAEGLGGTVTAVSMGPERAMRACRRALAVGVDRALLVTDDALRGSDVLGTAKVLARTIAGLTFDLVIAGVESADGATGAVPGAVAELLDLPAATFASHVEVAGRRLSVRRQTSAGYDILECDLPALVTVTAGAAEVRHPSVRDTVAARKKVVEHLALADLGLAPDVVRPTHSVTAVEIAPEREPGEVVDAEEGIDRIVQLLAQQEVLA
jgi:electron transfer flavoprotein beta subunit